MTATLSSRSASVSGKSGRVASFRWRCTFLLGSALGLAAAPFAQAQRFLDLPVKSQRAVTSQRIALTDIKIDYHRPLVAGRKVWGGLVPYGDVWRAGADENTTIEFSSAVTVEGKPLPKGTYGLHMIPTADSWTVIFNKVTTGWGSFSYKEAEDALRVTVKPVPSETREALQFDFDDLKPTSTAVTMKWEKLAVPFQVAVSDETTTLENVRAQMLGVLGFTWDGWNSAANFCLERKTNLEEALTWIEKSIAAEERSENVDTKAKILKALNRTADANAAAARSLEISTPPQLYFKGRGMQGEGKHPEALEIFKLVAKKHPQTIYGHLALARLASSAGDHATASKEAKVAQGLSTSDAQKKAIQTLIDKAEKKEDINK